jgi:hypothetical protein
MFILRKLAAMVTSESAPEENLLSTVAQGDGFFITSPGAVLKAGRYKVIRKLGRGRFSNTFLVEDLQPRYCMFSAVRGYSGLELRLGHHLSNIWRPRF